MSVASKSLGSAANLGTSETTIYTVPTGKRSIVKNVTVVNNAGSANWLIISVYTSGGTLLFFWHEFLTAQNTNGDSVVRDTWLVIHESWELRVQSHVAGLYVAVSGAELTL